MLVDDDAPREADTTVRIEGMLRELHSSLSNLACTALINADGRILAGRELEPDDEERLASMAASALILGGAGTRTLQLGELRQVVVRRRDGCGVTMRIGAGAVLAVEAREPVRLGMILLRMRQVADRIGSCLVETPGGAA